jgi:hypothetical protein
VIDGDKNLLNNAVINIVNISRFVTSVPVKNAPVFTAFKKRDETKRGTVAVRRTGKSRLFFN